MCPSSLESFEDKAFTPSILGSACLKNFKAHTVLKFYVIKFVRKLLVCSEAGMAKLNIFVMKKWHSFE